MKTNIRVLLSLCSVATVSEALTIRRASPPPLAHVHLDESRAHRNTSLGDETIIRRNNPNGDATGLYVDWSTCSATQLESAHIAISSLGQLAIAGRAAVSEPFVGLMGNPAPYFFAPSDFTFIWGLMNTALNSATGQKENSRTIRVTCADLANLCNSVQGPADRILGAYVNPDREIVLCSRFFKLPYLEPSCSSHFSIDGLLGVGALSQGQVLLHMFAHAVTATEKGKHPNGWEVRDYAFGTHACYDLLWRRHSITRNNPNLMMRPRFNADSFARMAAWAHDIGLADLGEPDPLSPWPKGTCVDRFKPNLNGAIGEFPTNKFWLNDYIHS